MVLIRARVLEEVLYLKQCEFITMVGLRLKLDLELPVVVIRKLVVLQVEELLSLPMEMLKSVMLMFQENGFLILDQSLWVVLTWTQFCRFIIRKLLLIPKLDIFRSKGVLMD